MEDTSKQEVVYISYKYVSKKKRNKKEASDPGKGSD